MSYAVKIDRSGWRSVDSEADVIVGEVFSLEVPILTETPMQITAQKVQEANAFLKSTDWVEPLIIAHKLGLEGYVLSPDSNKLLIDAQRDEARAFVRANS